MFKLSSVLSNIVGVSGKRILAKLADKGELSVLDIRTELDRRCKSKPEEIECAINGVLKPTSRVLLKLQLQKIASCERQIDEIYDHMLRLSQEHASAVQIIASIPGMSIQSAIYIVAEIGTDLSSFKTANHLTAWAGLAPKANQSADKARPSKTKRANQYVKTLLIQCAWAAIKTRNTRLSLWYWHNRSRLGDKKAITAVARKLLCYIYAMLGTGAFYDKNLDVAYAELIGAHKLDAARKTIGSRSSNAPPSDCCGSNNYTTHHAKDEDGINRVLQLPIEKTISGKLLENGIQSPNEIETPKKRGRPRKSAAPCLH